MKRLFLFLTYLSYFCLMSPLAQAALREYEIDIQHQTVNFTGKDIQAMTVGGTIPGTTIEAGEGDTLRVTFHNRMEVDTSIHWHGILLPNDQDGVPYLTTMPIHAHSSFTYEYPVIQSGTYWYHSHTGLQEQRGVYGALIFHPAQETIPSDREYVIGLSDWNDENPHKVLRNLKSDGDYYALKKGTVQSWYKVFKYKAWWMRLKQSWSRMGPMDLSDVGYDLFLMNGQASAKIGDAQPGEKIRLRLINMSSSTYFNVEFSGGEMEVIAADGLDVVPFKVKRIPIAIAETYDVIVTLPENKAYELRATSTDGTGYALGTLGQGDLVKSAEIAKPNPMVMDHSMMGGDMAIPMDHSKMDHSKMMHGNMAADNQTLDYKQLRSQHSTKLPAENQVREVVLNLTGNMDRYIWSFNDKTLEQEDTILIRKGENVRFILANKTMMHHPIHLHGHFFRVLNGQGDYSPLKHTVDVKPMQTTVIEFEADKEKDWLFHCHNLYHMMSGMSRIVRYEGSVIDPALQEMRKNHKVHEDHAHWYAWGDIAAQSNLAEGFLRMTDDLNQFEAEWDHNYTGEYDFEAKYLRNQSRFLDIFTGGEFVRNEHGDIENLATAGFRYLLPLLVTVEYRLDHRGQHELSFESELQITDHIELHGKYRLGFEFENAWHYSGLDLTHEYRIEAEYHINKTFALVANYDSDHRGGGGVRLRF